MYVILTRKESNKFEFKIIFLSVKIFYETSLGPAQCHFFMLIGFHEILSYKLSRHLSHKQTKIIYCNFFIFIETMIQNELLIIIR